MNTNLEKYLKYKLKYLNLKTDLTGGDDQYGGDDGDEIKEKLKKIISTDKLLIETKLKEIEEYDKVQTKLKEIAKYSNGVKSAMLKGVLVTIFSKDINDLAKLKTGVNKLFDDNRLKKIFKHITKIKTIVDSD